jgi:putative Holliday junction resolvase
MKYLGIDYGTKRVGIAMSDEGGSFAFPQEILLNDTKVLEALARIIEKEGVGAVVIGDSLTLNGGDNDITKEVQAFIKRLESSVQIPVHRVREAWSSQEAARFAPDGKKHDDSAAAAIILQRYLDVRNK